MRNIYHMILLLAVSICSMACGPASKNKALSLPIFKEKILTLTDDERYNINIRYQAIANAEEAAALSSIDLQNYVRTFEEYAIIPMDIEKSMHNLAQWYIEGGVEYAEQDDPYNYQLEQSAFLVRNDSVLCYETHVESYTGGVHANYTLWYECFDLATGLLYDFNYLLSDTWGKAIGELIYAHLMDIEGVSYFDDISAHTIHIPEAVLITDSGVLLAYQPYEIASYNDGIITVEITDAEIAATGAPLVWVE